MSFFLADQNGFVCDVSTARGWFDVNKELKEFISGQATPLSFFFAKGETDKPEIVSDEINQVLPFIKDKSVKKTLAALQVGLRKCKDKAIISQ